jgi:hypothetical protein
MEFEHRTWLLNFEQLEDLWVCGNPHPSGVRDIDILLNILPKFYSTTGKFRVFDNGSGKALGICFPFLQELVNTNSDLAQLFARRQAKQLDKDIATNEEDKTAATQTLKSSLSQA